MSTTTPNNAQLRHAPIAVPESVLDDLRTRLHAIRWPEQLPREPWTDGASLDYIRELCAYWADEYDWRANEAWFNSFEPFLVEVDGLDLHVWKVAGTGVHPVPLLLLHGWPGSVTEFRHILEPLTTPDENGLSFDVVMPSLPGYGFGGKPAESGWGVTRSAEAFNTLMTEKLGYASYGVQGGDWGAVIGAKLASLHPETVLGLHTNMPLFGWLFDPEAFSVDATDAEKAMIERGNIFAANERGYSMTQGTKPMSLAIGQTDSPAGLAAWIIEKFQSWSDCGGDIESVFSRNDLITNLMFYWAPDSVASAAALYYEARRDPDGTSYPPITVPTGVAAFPREIYPASRRWVESRYSDLRQWTEMPRGGHFAALEQSGLLLPDIRSFFGLLR
ncbi:MAG: epoxide hydratase [Microbacteriaceae bacterium]|nr:epoxide hydratase [Microbacteriaceae bacterium]